MWPPESHSFATFVLDSGGSLIGLCERGMLQAAPVENYKRISNLIRRQIEERAWNEPMQSYVSVLDGDQLDSSLLLLSWYGFEEAESPECVGLTALSGNI